MSAISEPALALFLLDRAKEAGRLVAVLRGAGRLDRVATLAAVLADGVQVVVLPPPDVLPYDLVRPSSEIVGRRVKALTELSRPHAGPLLLLTSATATLQRVRPAVVWRDAAFVAERGDRIDADAFRAALAERGYRWDERIDEPGEAAVRGQVIDIFPAGERAPARLMLEDDRIADIVCVDPVTLRSTHKLERLELRPATELRIDSDDMTAAQALLEPDADTDAHQAELQLPRRLVPVFALMDGVSVYRDDEVDERWQSVRDGIDDAYDAARKAGRLTGEPNDLPPPDRLFLSVEQVQLACADRVGLGTPRGEAVDPPRRIDDLVEAVQSAGAARVLIASPGLADSVAASLRKRGLDATAVTRLGEIAAGQVGVIEADLASGLRTDDILLLPIGALLRPQASATLATGDEAPRVGETVVHLEHGICRLEGVRDVDGQDRIALEFADGIELLIAPDELDRVWRYGDGGAPLDRLGAESWHRRRDEIEAELRQTASALAARAAERQASTAPVLRAPASKSTQVARRFPYKLSQDQRAAVHDVLQDLASGRRMDRLLCGDVGFGKTEVAIRAAAAAAFAGWQVAIAAPTTVLARQHLDIFRRRFDGTGVRVDGLTRAAGPGARDLRRDVRDGSVGIVIGTQALAGLDFARLGLVVIDEEQRFGETDKGALAGLAPHVLAMTATPIPRTMQEALVGLRDVSVLATPPQNRQPNRTFVLPWDTIVVREALLREQRRGGQSFVVCPRIADLERLAAELAGLVPELSVISAHGRMRPDALESAVLGFADGHGDVLLATNIIEAGLDIPRANLMLVTDADRFGLAQLHQLRGRVGRSARRGAAYFLTAPGRKLAEATRRRLATMSALSALGAGVAISAADLDQRGAGDLFGERQSGHVRAVGTELYQHLLIEALARHRGTPEPPPAPMLRVELDGGIPSDYVPEENLRIALLRRLARLDSTSSLREFGLELEDRFGPPPPPTMRLLALQRLRIACRARAIAQIDAGPQACALTPSDAGTGKALARALGGSAKDGRILLDLAVRDPLERAEALAGALSG